MQVAIHRSGSRLPARSALALASGLLFAGLAQAAPTSILFVGNSFTYGEPAGGPPVVEYYRPSTVTDLNNSGIGGVPALFKQFTVESGLSYNVSLETVPGVGIDYHYQNKLALLTAQPYDQVVLQSYSTLDGAHPGNPATLIQYTNLLGTALRNVNPNVDIHLDATWSRADQTYLPSGHWYGSSIYQMANDVRAGYDLAKADNPTLVDDVIHTGSAWNRLFTNGFADTNPYDGIDPGKVDMWAPDDYHASIYGYYLEALMFYGDITKLDPTLLGFDQVAMDLGITASQAAILQATARMELLAIPEPDSVALVGIGVVAAALALRRSRRRASAAPAA